MYLNTLKTLAAVMTLLSSTAGTAAANIPNEPVYFEGGQYSASLLQTTNTWRLQPLTGDDVDVIDRACANPRQLPSGVWLVSRDADGRPQLVAPSSTTLPAGFPEQIALRACGEREDPNALAVPAVVLAWLEDNVNSVLIDD
jgi:hypothetical protein